MTEKAVEAKAEALPDLDDLLQCPVCYEIPEGQIFQCNEGHHVCGRCKLRLDVCPVCRAFFFGTRNYAMEELIANIRKLRAFKLGGKITTTGNITPVEQNVEVKESTSEDNESTHNEEDGGSSSGSTARVPVETPNPSRGLFRCLCCKTNPERLPSARLLNHLRYFHSPELIEGRSDENREYLQAWQFSTDEGRIVTAIRVADMGLFFLVIEITDEYVFAWLVMAASPIVAEEFSYTFTLSGNDREAIFSDCVWSVRACEGFLKKRQRCLAVEGADARALLLPRTMNAKLSLRRTPLDVVPLQAQPRAVLRVANRSVHGQADPESQDLEPFLQDLQNDVARLSRAFATLGREANALARSEAEMRARLEMNHRDSPLAAGGMPELPSPPQVVPEVAPSPEMPPEPLAPLSRSARRRMRQRLRQAFRENQNIVDFPQARPAPVATPPPPASTNRTENAIRQTNGPSNPVLNNNRGHNEQTNAAARPTNSASNAGNNARVANNNANSTRTLNNHTEVITHLEDEEIIRFQAIIESIQSEQAPPQPPPAASNGNSVAGRNKKKRRQRR